MKRVETLSLKNALCCNRTANRLNGCNHAHFVHFKPVLSNVLASVVVFWSYRLNAEC